MELVVRKGVIKAGGGAGSGGYGGALSPPHESPVILRERILIWDKCEQKCVALGKCGHGKPGLLMVWGRFLYGTWCLNFVGGAKSSLGWSKIPELCSLPLI